MKFIDLKKKLAQTVDNVYLISGSDRFLCYKALEAIEKRLNISIPDMNSVILLGDQCDAKDIIDSASVFPFGDEYRLVVVKNFNPKINGTKKTDNEIIIENYLDAVSNSTILVFFNIDGDEFFKNLKMKLTFIDCDKIDLPVLVNVIKSDFSKHDIQIKEETARLFALYCNLDMARISTEEAKLISFAAKKGEITDEDIKELIVEDKEYQIFELAELIAKNNKDAVFDMVQRLDVQGKSGFSILLPLYNNYRRVLYTAINSTMSDKTIAESLGVKEYAIKMCRNQAKVFTPKKLKQIVDMLANADKNIKSGKIKEDVAIKTIIVKILKLRG